MEWFDLNIIWLLLTFKYIDDRSKLFLSLNNNSTKSKILLKLKQQHQFQPNEAYFPESIKIAHRINAKIVGPFIHCSFGKEYYNNSDQAKSYLSSLEQSVPGAIVYISVSTFTSIDFESFKNYNLKIYFDRFGELTKEDIKKKYEYSQSVRFYGINSGEVYALHHYYWLLPEYLNKVNENVKKIIICTQNIMIYTNNSFKPIIN